MSSTVEPNAAGRSPAIAEAKEDITERFGYAIARGDSTSIYTLQDAPNDVVKEIQTDGLTEHALESLKTSLHILTQLHHPNILRCTNIWRQKDCFYVQMARYPKSLEAFLHMHNRQNQLPAQSIVLMVVHQVATTLAYLADSNKENDFPVIAHGGIKPANILLNERMDSIILSDTKISKEVIFGASSVYCSPEVLLGERPTPASDMWALGVILYELVTGDKPVFLRDQEPRDVFVPSWRPNLSYVRNSAVRSIIERLLVLEPEQRIKAKELADELEFSRSFLFVAHTLQIRELQASFAYMEGEAQSQILSLQKMCKKDLANMQESLARIGNENTQKRLALKENLTATHTTDQRFEEEILQITEKVREKQLQELSEQHKQIEDKQKKSVDRLRDELTRVQTAYTKVEGHYKQGLSKLEEKLFDIVKSTTSKIEDQDAVFGKKHSNSKDDNGNKNECSMEAPNVVEEYAGLQLQLREFEKRTLNRLIKFAAISEKQAQTTICLISSDATALMRAAIDGDRETVQQLIESEIGTELLRKKNSNNMTALMYAANRGHKSIAEVLATHENGIWGNGKTAMLIAAECGHKEIVDMLAAYEKGIVDEDGKTALMKAASRGDTESVKLLLEHEKCIQTTVGETALMFAVKNGYMNAVELLAPHEKCIWASDKSAMLMAAEKDNKEMVDFLAQYEKGTRSACGQTSLMFAAAANNVEAVKLLYDYEKDVCGDQGETSLICAASKGSIESIDLLLNNDKGSTDRIG